MQIAVNAWRHARDPSREVPRSKLSTGPRAFLGVLGLTILNPATIVYFALNYLSRLRPFRNVDDTLGVVYTHGFAGLAGGLLTGVFALVAATTKQPLVGLVMLGVIPISLLLTAWSWHHEQQSS